MAFDVSLREWHGSRVPLFLGREAEKAVMHLKSYDNEELS